MAHETKFPLSARIVAARRSLERILDSFWSFVVSLFSKRHAPGDSIPPNQNSSDARNRSEDIPDKPVRVIIDSFPPKPSPTKKEKTKEKIEKGWKIGKGLLEVLAVVGLFLYVRETHKTNKIAIDSMRQSQRPWIGPYQQIPLITGPIIIDKMGIRVDYRMSAVNYGSFGANNVNFWAQLYIAQDISTIQQRAEYACANSTSNSDMGTILFPGQNMGMLNAWPALAMDIIKSKNANPPYDTYQAYLLTCIGYRDQFGIPHHTGTIYRSTPPGGAGGDSIMITLTPNQSIPVEWHDWHSFLD